MLIDTDVRLLVLIFVATGVGCWLADLVKARLK